MAPEERDRRDEANQAAGDVSPETAGGDAPEELRYEGPITIDDDEDEYLEEGGGSGRVFLTAAILSALVLVIIATAMWMRSDRGREPGARELASMEPPPPATPAETAPAVPGELDYRALPDTAAATGENPAKPELPPVEEPAAPPAAPPRAAAPAPPVERPRPRAARNVEQPSRPAPTATDTSPAAIRRLVRAGRVADAARAGAEWARRRPAGEWTLQVLLACAPQTVERAFGKVLDPSLVVLPARLDGRSCYRVCWGTFPSRQAAEASRRDVPGYFARDAKPLPRTWRELAP